MFKYFLATACAGTEGMRGLLSTYTRYLGIRVPLKEIEYGFGYITIRSPHTPYSTYLRGTIGVESPTCSRKKELRLRGVYKDYTGFKEISAQ